MSENLMITRGSGQAHAVNTLEDLYMLLEKCGKRTFGRVTTQDSIYSQLLRMFKSLVEESFQGKTGTFAKVLQGPKGLGKTSCLRNFASAASYMSRDVDTFYLAFPEHEDVPNDLLQEDTSLCSIIMKELMLSLSEPTERMNRSDQLVQALCEKDRRLVLIIDELDIMFQYNRDDCISFIDKSLAELNSLANTRSGRLMIIVSGSSSQLLDYMWNINAGPALKVLSLGHRLNPNRFRLLHVFNMQEEENHPNHTRCCIYFSFH